MSAQAFKLAIEAKVANVGLIFQGLGGASFAAPDNAWGNVWKKVQGHQIVQVVSMSQKLPGQAPWMTPPPAVGGRIYHDTGYDYWASYLASTRTGKLSRYQFRDKSDFFAELYATYYCTVPAGTLVQGWNAGIHIAWFTKNVDAGRGSTPTPCTATP